MKISKVENSPSIFIRNRFKNESDPKKVTKKIKIPLKMNRHKKFKIENSPSILYEKSL